MKKICSKILFFCLIYSSEIVTSAPEVKGAHQKEIITHLMKVNEKVDFLSDRMDKIEEKSSTEINVINFEEIKANIKQLISINEELVEKTEKISKIEKLLYEIMEAKNEQKNESKKDVFSKLSSQCTSLCEEKVNFWANETSDKFKADSEKVDFCFDNSTIKYDQNTSNICTLKPCLNRGLCEVSLTGSDYTCKCLYPSSGKNCQNLNCNAASRCFQHQDTFYVVFEDNLNWEQARAKCVSEGMRLAMPKHKATSDYLVAQLKTMFPPAQQKHFWFGLNNNGSGWRWLDGAPLEGYTGGVAEFKSVVGAQWALMGLHGGNKMWWPRTPAEYQYWSPARYFYYPLCEHRDFSRF